MCYLYGSLDHAMIGWIGDPPKDLSTHIFVDAEFAGCPYTLKSTSDAHADAQGPNSRFPWGAGPAGQTSVAQSTPEAELSSLHLGMKKRGETALIIWYTMMQQFHDNHPEWKAVVNLHEDNTTAIVAARTGKNPTMTTLERGFGVSIAYIRNRVTSGELNLIHTESRDMADIYTKGIANPELFTRLRKLINVFSPQEIEKRNLQPKEYGKERDTIPKDQKGYANPQFFNAMSGESTACTDFRKSAKVKRPNGSGKRLVRPRPTAVDEDADDESEGRAHSTGTLAVASAQFQQEINKVYNEECYNILKEAKWMVVLLCAEPDSYMQMCNPFKEHCECIDITEIDDLKSEKGRQKVAKIIRSQKRLLSLRHFHAQSDACSIWASIGKSKLPTKDTTTLETFPGVMGYV